MKWFVLHSGGWGYLFFIVRILPECWWRTSTSSQSAAGTNDETAVLFLSLYGDLGEKEEHDFEIINLDLLSGFQTCAGYPSIQRMMKHA